MKCRGRFYLDELRLNFSLKKETARNAPSQIIFGKIL
nr:MAG TPA: hypothetical protein [Caudoviricetes sp.]